jgi:hypothetical protein
VKHFVVRLLLFLFVVCVFYKSPVHYLSDGRFSLLMDEAILRHGTPNMIRYQVPRGQGIPFVNHGYLWTIDLVKGRLLYIFPWGGALLSLPAVAVFNAAGFRVAPHSIYSGSNELEMQAILATLLCALAVWVFYETASFLLPLGWSLAIALSAAFGTQIWSDASRTLWPQTWYLLLMALAISILMSGRGGPVLLGTILAWACFARPGAAVIVGAITGYVLIKDGPAYFLRYAAAGAAWSISFVGMMMYFEGVPFAAAYPLSYLNLRHDFLTRLEGVLLSPSRGLFIFVPIVLLPLYLILRYWKDLPRRQLVVLALMVIILHIILLASHGPWWGGGAYGPRDLLETIPWFVLLTILGIKAFLDDPQLSMHECSAVISVALLLLILSVAMNAAGALSSATLDWNDRPSINSHPERVWDWQHPQFLAWVQE